MDYLNNMAKHLEDAISCGLVSATHIALAVIPSRFINSQYWASYFVQEVSEAQNTLAKKEIGFEANGPIKAPIGFRTCQPKQ